MGWIDMTSNGELQFYSVADSIENFKESFFAIIQGMEAGYIVFMLVSLFALIAVGVMWSIYRSIKDGYIVA